MQLTDETIIACVAGLASVRKQISYLGGGAQGQPGLRREVTQMRVVTDFRKLLENVCGAFLGRARNHLNVVLTDVDLFVERPSLVRLSSARLCSAHVNLSVLPARTRPCKPLPNR
jgi:hypothetical protein